MEYQCVCCEFESDDKRDFIRTGGKIEPKTICKYCAGEIHLTDIWQLNCKGNLGALEKYVEVYPEAQPKLDRFFERLEEYEKENMDEQFKNSCEE